MVKRIAILLFSLSFCALHAGLTLVNRELFVGVGTVTSGSPGAFSTVDGTLYKAYRGPSAAGAGAFWSAECGHPTGSSGINSMGWFSATGAAGIKWYLGGWFFIKSINAGAGEAYLDSICYSNGNPILAILAKSGTLQALVNGNYTSISGVTETNQWLWLGVAARHITANNYDVRFYYKTLSGSMTLWAAKTNYNVNVDPVNLTKLFCGVRGGASQNPPTRLGTPSFYTFANTDFSDVVYPASDIDQPETPPYSWYVDAAAGDDSNTGIASNAAWKTASKLNDASKWLGVFSSDSGFSGGDRVYIDTSGADLDIAGTSLIVQTKSLNLLPIAGQDYWRMKAFKTMTNSAFSALSGTAHVYQSSDTAANSVIWEDDKWLAHSTGATLASVTNALDTTAGSFWTDGTKMYVHPFGDSNPTSDGKRYERSYYYQTPGAALELIQDNLRLSGLYSGKTCVADKSSNDPIGNYTVGSDVPFGGTCQIDNCFFYYSAKHALGLTADATGSSVLISDVQSEQGSPYGSQTPFVSFMNTGSGNVHSYLRCTTVNAAGLVGSTNGTPGGTVFIAHGNSPAIDLQFNNCHFSKGELSVNNMNSLVATNCAIGIVKSYITNSVTLERCTLDTWGIAGYQTTNIAAINVYDSLWVPTQALTAGQGSQLSNTVTISRCTFDFSGIPSANQATAAFFNRIGNTILSFSNNVVIVPSGTNYTVFGGFTTNDTLAVNRNVYRLGPSAKVVYSYNDGLSTSDRTFSQWQSLGFDANSVNQEPCFDSRYRPYSKTPGWTIGAEFGPATDFTGKLFQSRRTAGAYEYTANPMMIQ